tara:strand:- start:1344 stop:1652 length:309 start_codon:yes stop_codon:yes gene_type:complete
MSEGFGEKKTKADRDLLSSTRELAALHKVLKKYPQDSAGRRKMLKRIKKYYRGPLAELDRIDMKPPVLPTEQISTDEEIEAFEKDMVTAQQAQAFRENLRKT